MGGGSFPEIPDWRIYKVSDAPRLIETQEKLARLGLKDPWLRNEVWRYTMRGVKGETTLSAMRKSLFRGFPHAAALATILICGEKLYHKVYPPVNDGHH